MTEVSFKSTYRIPLTGPGITPAKKDALKKLVKKYPPNVLYPNGNTGNVRVSIRKRLDKRFENALRQLHIDHFQKFDRHFMHKNNMDEYIYTKLKTREYKSFGTQKRAK